MFTEKLILSFIFIFISIRMLCCWDDSNSLTGKKYFMDKLLADIDALIARGITPNLAAKIINDVRSGKAQKSKNHHMISFIIFTMILSFLSLI